MFFKLIRDWKISKNHRRRVRSIVLKSNEEIVRTMDYVKRKYLESERIENRDDTVKFKAQLEVFEWLINETA